MVMPAFGFSVGDFIAVIGLCTKVAKALKEAGGAAAEYQQVIIEIEGLQDALTRLAALEPTESNIDHVNAIRKMALACRLPLQDFLSKLEKYDATMSPFATGSSFRSTEKKVRYAVSMAEEVKTVRAMISGKVISINLLLATHASESLSRNEERLSANQESIISRLEEAKDGMSRIRQDIDRMDATANTSREELRKETARSTSQLIEQLKQVEKIAESTDQGVSSLNIGVTPISASLTRLGDLGIQALTIMRTLPSELRTILRTVLQTNMQMYTVLLEVHRKIAAPPTLALESNIRVEDALGEIRSLPFEWFRHWEPFEGLLRAEFKNRLGAERVERGDFRLVHARRPTISIDKSNWSQTITAGSDILMLMYLSGLACQESACPRQSCNGQTPRQAQSNTMLTCPECGLRFIPQPMFSEGTEAKTIEQLQIEEDVRLFGSRDGPYVSGISELYTQEISTNGDAEELKEYATLEERGEENAHHSSKRVPSPSEQKTLTSHEGHASIINDSSEPPIYAWLADTEPPKDPDSVVRWREAEEARRVHRQQQNLQDLEVFRNVEIAYPLTDDVPMYDAHDSARLFHTGPDDPATGSYVLYRNILDQYPDLEGQLAWRFANMNWKRMEDFQTRQRTCSASTPDRIDSSSQCGHDPPRGADASFHEHNAPSRSHAAPFGDRIPSKARKLCSLPPLPRLVPQSQAGSGYRAKCHLCYQDIHLRSKRDWSNHVMEDLRPYMCPIAECASGDDMYARRRDLSAHLRNCHPLETCSQCAFCGKATDSHPIKHLGHHMEEIAFGVLSTAYEQWSYDDTDSDVPVPPVRSLSPYPSKDEEKRFSCVFTPRCQLNFINFEDSWAHIRNHPGDPSAPPGLNSTLNSLQYIPVTESIPQADSNYSRCHALDTSQDMAPDYQEMAQDNYYGAAGEDNYWTRSAHPSSSASSVNSQLRTSLSNDYQLPRPKDLLGASMPPAPQSLMSQFSTKVSSASQKKHKCKVCDKRFTRPSSLQTHMYSHTGEKPFACEFQGCGRHFTLVSNLRRHRKVHKNEYPADINNADDDDKLGADIVQSVFDTKSSNAPFESQAPHFTNPWSYHAGTEGN